MVLETRTRIDTMKDLILAFLNSGNSSLNYTDAEMMTKLDADPEIFAAAMGELVREFRVAYQKHWDDSPDEPPTIILRGGNRTPRIYIPPDLNLCPTAKVNLPPIRKGIIVVHITHSGEIITLGGYDRWWSGTQVFHALNEWYKRQPLQHIMWMSKSDSKVVPHWGDHQFVNSIVKSDRDGIDFEINVRVMCEDLLTESGTRVPEASAKKSDQV